MKMKTALIAACLSLLTAGSAFAFMGGGGGMGGMGNGMNGGMGYGMNGAGGMRARMLALTKRAGYLNVLTPLTTTGEAVTAVQNFIIAANSSLQISAVWEYQTAYKVELSDASGHKSFDVVADKLTGTVLPEMGFSMMMNASYGMQLQKTVPFGRNLALTPDQATTAAQDFVAKNLSVINYSLANPETYPGYYKFHTTNLSSGTPGFDIMVNGYNGSIWMNTQLGAPIAQIQ